MKGKSVWKIASYDDIFSIFRLSALIEIKKRPNVDKIGNKKLLLLTVNIIETILQLTTNISFVIQSKTFMSKTNMSMTIIALTHRWILYFRIGRLHSLSKRATKLSEELSIPVGDRFNKWADMFAKLNLLLYIPLAAVSFISLHAIHFRDMVFGYDCDELLSVILITIFLISLFVFMLLPLSVFSMYYTYLCLNLRSIMKQFQQSLDVLLKHKPEYSLRLYLSIKGLVVNMDSDLSLLMFTTSLYNTSTMYFGVTIWLHSEEYGTLSSLSSIWVLLTMSYIAFISMGISASFVHEAASDVYTEAEKRLNNGNRPAEPLRQFLKVADKELFLTVWRIVPIKRNFILGTIGTIFTYCILLETVQDMY
ncbi:uncharacterized protein TNCT_364191 [Trichonephila clavata]|uniref:Gustatory receptor n=1 Tax=Trichonephila clavata TaxID=2740835 RepID=A0A8X6GAV3_TRICU|nr:uncharacterized protein TNCT_364191 [Trichonephila clavata]